VIAIWGCAAATEYEQDRPVDASPGGALRPGAGHQEPVAAAAPQLQLEPAPPARQPAEPPAVAPLIDDSKVVDLTWPFNEKTIYWPTARRFELSHAAWGRNQAGRWYASNDFCASEHGGTHLDAPIHFAEGRMTTAEIPAGRLIGPARVIDIRQHCEADRNYLLAPEDIRRHEEAYGTIEPGSIVLVLTGWGRYWPDALAYLGSEARGVATELSFPGIGVPAAHLLVERQVDLVGLDTASLDHGPSTDFSAHRVLSAANVPGLENVAHLERLPPTGAWVIALPMKIEGGTGGPCRVIAVVP
jgi:kynurenine formamidase